METFDFTKIDNEYMYNMGSNMILHIKRINHSVAILYFTDEMNNKINIPEDIVVYTYYYQDTNIKIIQKPIKQDYHLCWTDNYTIEYKKIQILSLNSQRKWNIMS
jgi:phosphate starvation-inducible membrane PsiE